MAVVPSVLLDHVYQDPAHQHPIPRSYLSRRGSPWTYRPPFSRSPTLRREWPNRGHRSRRPGFLRSRRYRCAIETVTDFRRFAHLDVCRLITAGRVTGSPHDIEIWFALVDTEVCMISGNGRGADWFLNALAEPRVTIRFESESRAGLARPAESGSERRLVGEAMAAKYAGSGGDSSIGLGEDEWTWIVPALMVSPWHRR